jgi:hypothetical protein
MEGRLHKWGGFFTRWREHNYILHEGILHEYNILNKEEISTVHLAVSTISANPRQPLQIIIHNGVSFVYLRAPNIKTKVEWVNALKESKGEVLSQEKGKSGRGAEDKSEKSNEALAKNIYNKFDPLYQKIGKVWSTQAQFEEIMSIMEPEMAKSPKLKHNSEKLLVITNQLKESVAEVLYDLEVARKDFLKAIQKFTENDDGIEIASDSDEEYKSMTSIRSVKIIPRDGHDAQDELEGEDEYMSNEEEKIETAPKSKSNFDPRDLSDDMPTRNQLSAFKDHTKTFSIWGLIRDNIGQDLTRVTLPIILNEPVTMLQKCAEGMENYALMDKAVNETDS